MIQFGYEENTSRSHIQAVWYNPETRLPPNQEEMKPNLSAQAGTILEAEKNHFAKS
jgi:hypothetical protein